MGIFAELVKAIDWYDVSLQSILAGRGIQSFNRTQSVMLIHIAEGITKPSEIARDMGATRQNIHAMAKPLIDAHIIKVVPDPDDGRSKQYAFCEDSLELRDMVLQLLKYLDRKLGERIGKDDLKDLKRVLSVDWGEIIVQAP
ncbi:MAG: MarR family winged helix-turn-helix transcriptional regulator [bacterium]|jgi:DNA-binding MarR family transcriptional regulator|nr:MarR family transcriptional regulator [Gammaproteobacteria bacterium]HIL84959.1 MarR family transcriptional regulator [Pseudomonadales bacterium]